SRESRTLVASGWLPTEIFSGMALAEDYCYRCFFAPPSARVDSRLRNFREVNVGVENVLFKRGMTPVRVCDFSEIVFQAVLADGRGCLAASKRLSQHLSDEGVVFSRRSQDMTASIG